MFAITMTLRYIESESKLEVASYDIMRSCLIAKSFIKHTVQKPDKLTRDNIHSLI